MLAPRRFSSRPLAHLQPGSPYRLQTVWPRFGCPQPGALPTPQTVSPPTVLPLPGSAVLSLCRLCYYLLPECPPLSRLEPCDSTPPLQALTPSSSQRRSQPTPPRGSHPKRPEKKDCEFFTLRSASASSAIASASFPELSMAALKVLSKRPDPGPRGTQPRPRRGRQVGEA